jgi:hypothetical protein
MLDLLRRGRHLVFDTALDGAEVATRLQREITPPVWPRREHRPQLFEGRFDGERFSMVRLVRGRNSFRPEITGRLAATPAGTRVDVTLRAHPAVVVISSVLVLIGVAIVGVLVQDWMQTGELLLPALPLLGMPAVPAIGLVVLTREARKATQMLESLFGVGSRSPAAPGGTE